MNITPNKQPLLQLVEGARDGSVCLPNFQRDYVWKRDQINDLLRSVIRGYFIGTVLLLRCDEDDPPFEPEFVRGSKPERQRPRPEWLVLDGQQRITSLLYALGTPDFPLKDTRHPRRFFISIPRLAADAFDEEVVSDVAVPDLGELATEDGQFARRQLPVSALASPAAFFRWKDRFEDYLRVKESDELERYREEIRDSFTDAVNRILTFQVATVELPRVSDSDSSALAQVCAIFEKLNSTGTELSVYDLLTARLFRHKIRLHNLWKAACLDNPRLNRWSGGKPDRDKMGVLVLRVLALLRDIDPKGRELINLRPHEFERDWRAAAAAVERGIELLETVASDGFGVFDRKWLPNVAILVPLAALRARLEKKKMGYEARAQLRHWYWSAVFTERYSSAAETRSRKDYVDITTLWGLRDAPAKDFEPEVFREARRRIEAPNFTVRDAATQASSTYRGVFCLLAIAGAKDWRRGENLTLQQLEDHHIFPRAYLRRSGMRGRKVNSVANRTLLSDETNRLIRDRAPGDYVRDKMILPQGTSVLSAHFITPAVLVSLEKATDALPEADAQLVYREFRLERESEIVRHVRDACGLKTVGLSLPALGSSDEGEEPEVYPPDADPSIDDEDAA